MNLNKKNIVTNVNEQELMLSAQAFCLSVNMTENSEL